MATFKFNVLQLNSIYKKIILFILDNFICFVSFFLAYYLRLDLFLVNESQNQLISFLILYSTFLILCFSFSFYRPLSRYYNLLNVAKIILVFFFYAFLMTLLFDYLKLPGIPRSLGLLHPIIFLIFFISSRIFANFFVRKFYHLKGLKNAIIYCNINSAESLKNILRSYNILFFITDDKNFEKRLMCNIPIYTLLNLKKSMLKNKKIDFLFIDPNLNTEKVKRKILSKIDQKERVSIKIIPKIQNFLDYQFKEDIKNIKIFNRKINFSSIKLKKTFQDSTILITGAGGSIGNELVKEILRLEPENIILIENSEYNLYKVLEELDNLKSEARLKTKIKFFLVSVTDSNKIKNICVQFKPNYIFHCAAFKHVPLVEKNIVESVENNFKSTMNLCKIALELDISKLILISSDKAVRPSSVMGATKRLSELAIKYFSLKSNIQKKRTSFSAVRFANVLNSSGSVVPLFARQIKAGGPITITHKKVERYFMTIIDAVKLVLETTLISKNGNIMLLKMGKQIKIMNVAKKIANFYNHTIKDEKNPSGEIDVIEIGLRPGEKIREELHYDRKTKKTSNKDILCVDNLKLNQNKFKKLCQSINVCLKENDSKKLKSILLNQSNML
jgi:FlaA1/EpsC-like NDP-sugar epimerase